LRVLDAIPFLGFPPFIDLTCLLLRPPIVALGVGVGSDDLNILVKPDQALDACSVKDVSFFSGDGSVDVE